MVRIKLDELFGRTLARVSLPPSGRLTRAESTE